MRGIVRRVPHDARAGGDSVRDRPLLLLRELLLLYHYLLSSATQVAHPPTPLPSRYAAEQAEEKAKDDAEDAEKERIENWTVDDAIARLRAIKESGPNKSEVVKAAEAARAARAEFGPEAIKKRKIEAAKRRTEYLAAKAERRAERKAEKAAEAAKAAEEAAAEAAAAAERGEDADAGDEAKFGPENPFVASKEFAGGHAGYVFGNGKFGVGYYHDEHEGPAVASESESDSESDYDVAPVTAASARALKAEEDGYASTSSSDEYVDEEEDGGVHLLDSKKHEVIVVEDLLDNEEAIRVKNSLQAHGSCVRPEYIEEMHRQLRWMQLGEKCRVDVGPSDKKGRLTRIEISLHSLRRMRGERLQAPDSKDPRDKVTLERCGAFTKDGDGHGNCGTTHKQQPVWHQWGPKPTLGSKVKVLLRPMTLLPHEDGVPVQVYGLDPEDTWEIASKRLDYVRNSKVHDDFSWSGKVFEVGSGDTCEALEVALLGMRMGEKCSVTFGGSYLLPDDLLDPETKEKIWYNKWALARRDPSIECILEVNMTEVQELAPEPFEMKYADRTAAGSKLRERGNAAFKAQRYRRANVLYSRALWYLDPETASAQDGHALQEAAIPVHLNSALCLHKRALLDDAKKELDIVLAMVPGHAKALFRLGKVVLDLGDKKTALEHLENSALLGDAKCKKEAAKEIAKIYKDEADRKTADEDARLKRESCTCPACRAGEYDMCMNTGKVVTAE